MIRVAAASLLAALAFAACAQAPVAFVADAKGNATIEGAATLGFPPRERPDLTELSALSR